MSVGKQFRNLTIVGLLLSATALTLAISELESGPDETGETAGDLPAATPTRFAITTDGSAEPAPVPIPDSETEAEPTPESPPPDRLPTPSSTPTPGLSPTPEPEATPDTTNPPYPVACGSEESENDPRLQAVILDELGNSEEFYGVVVKELTSGVRAEVNPDQTYYGASLFKTAIMYELFRQVDGDAISLGTSFIIDDHYAAQDLGTLNLLGWTVGTEVSLEEALEAMITISDNASAILLGDLVGWERMDRTLAELGAVDTEFSSLDLPTTAADIAVILEAIVCSTGVERASSQRMLDLLAGQTVVNRLPRHLPDVAVTANKTGNWHEANHDAGIIYGPDTVYVIAVLSNYPPGADETIARVSRAVYDYFDSSEVIADDPGND